MYEYFEHTADLGIRVRGEDMPTLFVEAATALFAALIENLDEVEPVVHRDLTIKADRLDDLLHDWLADLLAIYDADRFIACRFEVRETDEGLTATIHGEPVNPDRHIAADEIKAITYHGLTVEKTDQGYVAEVIVDL